MDGTWSYSLKDFLKTLKEEEMAMVLAVQAPPWYPFLNYVELNLRFTCAAE
jgi:hypothetical protein